MLIEQFDAETDDDRLGACHLISASGHAEDDPNVPEIQQPMHLRNGRDRSGGR